MHVFRTDVHNQLGSATQFSSADPLSVYNTEYLPDRFNEFFVRNI